MLVNCSPGRYGDIEAILSSCGEHKNLNGRRAFGNDNDLEGEFVLVAFSKRNEKYREIGSKKRGN